MARKLVSNELWEVCDPIIPEPPPRSPKGGRPRIGNREALTGILFVLKTGIAWEDLPQEMGCGCGMTCWRRLTEWQAAGVWEELHRVMLSRLHQAGRIDWSRALLDSSHVKAPLGVEKSDPARWIEEESAASITC